MVQHQQERLVLRPVRDELHSKIGDDVGDVPSLVGLLAGRRVEDRIVIGALARQDLPGVEPYRIAAEMPFADHSGVVAALLQQTRKSDARAVEAVENRHAVQMRILSRQNRGAARRADRVRREHVPHQHAFARQPIEVGRLVDARSVGANGVRRVIVGHHEDDVGPVLRANSRRHRSGRDEQRDHDASSCQVRRGHIHLCVRDDVRVAG